MSRALIVEIHADIRRLIGMTLDFAGHTGEIDAADCKPFSPLELIRTLEDLGVAA